MRRWFIAFFALHFLASVGLFASGYVDASGAASESRQAVAMKSGVQDPYALGGDLLGAAPDHGLTHSQPDLPEVLHLAAPRFGVAHAPPTPVAPKLVKRAQPTLDGLQRPPRSPINT